MEPYLIIMLIAFGFLLLDFILTVSTNATHPIIFTIIGAVLSCVVVIYGLILGEMGAFIWIFTAFFAIRNVILRNNL